MKKFTDSQLIEIIAKKLFDVTKRLDEIESKLLISEDIFTLLNEFINPQTKDLEPYSNEEELVTFTEDFYQEICKHCGNRIDLMGIA